MWTILLAWLVGTLVQLLMASTCTYTNPCSSFSLWSLDEDDTVTTLDCPPLSKSRQSLAEQGDEVMPLWWDSGRQSQGQRKKGKFSQQASDADSAIGMVCVCVCVCVFVCA